MAKAVDIEKKTFEHYFDLSSKVRGRIINKMDKADRCRMTRCSKTCKQEVQSSKNYIYAFHFLQSAHDLFSISAYFGKTIANNQPDFTIVVKTKSGKNVAQYKNRSNQTLWEDELDSSTELVEHALQKFKDEMQNYHRYVKMFFISIPLFGRVLQPEELGIECLENLENLVIGGAIDVPRFLSKLQRPLKELHLLLSGSNSVLSNCKEIHQVQEKLTWQNGEFDYEQLSQLSAKNVYISVGQLTEREVFCFIRSWQNGSIGKTINSYVWSLLPFRFDIKKFVTYLRCEVEDLENGIEIKHFTELGVSAKLSSDQRVLHFEIIHRE